MVTVWADGGPCDGMVQEIDPGPLFAHLMYPLPPRNVIFGDHRYFFVLAQPVPLTTERGYAYAWWENPNPQYSKIRDELRAEPSD